MGLKFLTLEHVEIIINYLNYTNAKIYYSRLFTVTHCDLNRDSRPSDESTEWWIGCDTDLNIKFPKQDTLKIHSVTE